MAPHQHPKTMLAWQKHGSSKMPIRVEVPVPEPHHNEALIKLHAVGVCHSDVAVRDMEKMPPEFKKGKEDFTMGHEGCGEVISVGSSVKKVKPGDMVAMMCVPGCGSSTCFECSSRTPQVCRQGIRYGGGFDGFYAPYAVVIERAMAKLPTGVSPPAGAAATDACMTAYHAVVGTGQVKKGDTVLLFGLGGLGFNALQILLHIGARVIAVDQRQLVLDEAVKYGVKSEDIVPIGTKDLGEWVRQRNIRIDTTIDFVSMPETFKGALDSVRLAGTVVIVGLLSPELPLSVPTIVRKHLRILGSYGGTLSDVEACLDLISKGVLVPQVDTASLKDFPTILEDLHEGKVKSRIALIPEGMEEVS